MKDGYGKSRCDLLISNLSESGQSRGYIRGGERDGNVRSGGNQTSLPRWRPGVSLPSLQTPLRMLNQLTVNLPWKRRASSTTSRSAERCSIGALSSEVSVSPLVRSSRVAYRVVFLQPVWWRQRPQSAAAASSPGSL